MTRKKEKIVALNNYIHETSFSGYEVVKESAFIAGFEIADRTMLDRACEWLSIYYPNIDRVGIDKFITYFRRAMEGGAE